MLKEKKVIKKKKVKKNKLGFTLIELLAVIIILGVLLIIAVPAISRYIEESRQNTYINSVRSVVNAISVSVNNLDYPIPSRGEAIIVPFSEANLEKGNAKTKSPYAPYKEGKSYVVVIFNGSTYDYYVVAEDEAGYAIPLINDKELSVKSITTNTNIIDDNIYSLEQILATKTNNELLETNNFSMKYKGESGSIIKVKIGESFYNKGAVIQLKDGTKWYSMTKSDEDSKTVNLVSYNHMDTSQYNYGLQSESKTTPVVVYDVDGEVIYENADIYNVAQSIVSATTIKLTSNGLDMTGATVSMPAIADFCVNVSTDFCGSTLTYLSGNGGFWTTDYDGRYVLGIKEASIPYTQPNYGANQQVDAGYGIRVVIRNLLKSNINKEATRTLN